ncbi:MAG: DEAD/DEAH box helicase [Actinomycetota bacterium]
MDIADFKGRYGFALDPYQEEALGHLASGRSVLVAAPTGSGKTVVAEYALELARSSGKKFFYTTPLKALSNQKYRDLARAYSSAQVGLLTGDNSINGDAPIVVMTTEVLRNMIYEASPVLDDLGVVVLDEVHYMQDPARGAVWEEIVIMLPREVRLVALSATVSNAVDLAQWMDGLRGGVEAVLSSERPVRLENHYFVGRSMVPLFGRNLQRVISDEMEAAKQRQATSGRRRGGFDLRPKRTAVIRELGKRDMLPAIYFLFSRIGCDDSVRIWLSEGERLNSRDEEKAISEYLAEKVAPLEAADLECLDYRGFKKAMEWGVAAHHAGILPLFKEAVEELFARGLIKVVFATETLSLGINMPARTVVIESLVKWSGERHRPLTPGEYKQLTGRAGRRGIDELGHSVVLNQRYFTAEQVRSLVRKEPNPVVSSFKISYNMAANLLAGRDLAETQRLLNLSFAQFEADRRVVTLEARLASLESEMARDEAGSRCPEGDAAEYRVMERESSRLARSLSTLRRDRKQRDVKEAMVKMQPGDVFTTGGDAQARVMAVVRKHHGKKGDRGLLVVDPGGRYRRVTPQAMKQPPRILGRVDVSKITSPTRKVRRLVAARMEAMEREAGPEREAVGGSDEELELAGALDAVKEAMAEHPCRACMHSQRCLEAARRAEKTARRMESSRRERDSGFDVVSRRLADVVDLLNERRFMSGESLTERGQTLRRVYNECDLALVEALHEGVLSRLEPRELAALSSWFIYESRDSEDVEAHRAAREGLEHLEGRLGETLSLLDGRLDETKSSEDRRGLDILGSTDTGFGEASWLWAGEAELEDMLGRFPDRSVGDMVRTMKQMIDLLRQLAEVSPDRVLTENLGRAMDLIDRGVVGYSSIESIVEHGILEELD